MQRHQMFKKVIITFIEALVSACSVLRIHMPKDTLWPVFRSVSVAMLCNAPTAAGANAPKVLLTCS
jgi:hypothetical protein